MSNIGNIITRNSKSIIFYLLVICVLLIYIANKNHSKKSNEDSYESNVNEIESGVTENSMLNDDNTTQEEEVTDKSDNQIYSETNDSGVERPETGNLDFNK